jgi:glycosyltransferase involved in cell wall biosynthesis
LKLNILQLIPSFHQGGSERQAVQLTRTLHENGAHVRVACLERKGVLLDEVLSLAIGDVPEFPLTSFYDANAIRQVNRCRRMLREWEIDVVQTHDFYTNIFGMAAATVGRISAKIASKRETDGGLRSGPQRLAERNAFKLAHGIVANSTAVKNYLVGEGIAQEKIHTIHNGVDLARLQPSKGVTREELLEVFGLPVAPNKSFVTIVANLKHEVKGYPTFLRAAKTVYESVPTAAFVIAGEGDLLEPTRALAHELGIGERTHFIGRCQRVPDLLSVSSVCVLSSNAEGFSNSILEYMAAERPVVTTDVGGAREALAEGETGFIVPVGDHKALAERVIALLRDPEQARTMGKRGRQVVEQNFSCEAQLEKSLKLYEMIVERSGRTVRTAAE